MSMAGLVICQGPRCGEGGPRAGGEGDGEAAERGPAGGGDRGIVREDPGGRGEGDFVWRLREDLGGATKNWQDVDGTAAVGCVASMRM